MIPKPTIFVKGQDEQCVFPLWGGAEGLRIWSLCRSRMELGGVEGLDIAALRVDVRRTGEAFLLWRPCKTG